MERIHLMYCHNIYYFEAVCGLNMRASFEKVGNLRLVNSWIFRLCLKIFLFLYETLNWCGFLIEWVYCRHHWILDFCALQHLSFTSESLAFLILCREGSVKTIAKFQHGHKSWDCTDVSCTLSVTELNKMLNFFVPDLICRKQITEVRVLKC